MTEENRGASAGSPLEALVVTRLFDLPRERVWRAWTEPERLRCWWGPKGYTSPFARIDLRVGGSYLFLMRSSGRRQIWNSGVYREIVEPEWIVTTDWFSDANGNPIPASRYGLPGTWSLELTLTVTFEEADGKTRLTVREEGIPPGVAHEMAGAGWNQSLDKLADCLVKEKQS